MYFSGETGMYDSCVSVNSRISQAAGAHSEVLYCDIVDQKTVLCLPAEARAVHATHHITLVHTWYSAVPCCAVRAVLCSAIRNWLISKLWLVK